MSESNTHPASPASASTASRVEGDVALWQLVYGAIMGTDRKPVSVADFDAASKRVADMIERRAALSTPAPIPAPEGEMRRPLSDDQILTIASRGADKCHGFTGRALYVAREVERAHGIHQAPEGAAE